MKHASFIPLTFAVLLLAGCYGGPRMTTGTGTATTDRPRATGSNSPRWRWRLEQARAPALVMTAVP